MNKEEVKTSSFFKLKQWMSNKDSFDFYGLCEEFNNSNFNSVEFHLIKNNVSGRNGFLMNPTKWKKLIFFTKNRGIFIFFENIMYGGKKWKSISN